MLTTSSFHNSQPGSSSTSETGKPCIPQAVCERRLHLLHAWLLRDQELSFYKFPRDVTMKDRWRNAIKQKDFIPGEHHRVCSKHFQGGRKMGQVIVPAIFPLLPQPKAPRERKPLPNPSKRKKHVLTTTSVPDAFI